jgi:hypothetical protein
MDKSFVTESADELAGMAEKDIVTVKNKIQYQKSSHKTRYG